MSVVIKEVTSKKELKKFVKFNIELYKGNPYHVPGLIEEEMVTLDKKKNPAFEVCDAIYFLAYKDGKVVGRIAGMINRRSNETWNQKYARFGFVDFIDDAEDRDDGDHLQLSLLSEANGTYGIYKRPGLA